MNRIRFFICLAICITITFGLFFFVGYTRATASFFGTSMVILLITDFFTNRSLLKHTKEKSTNISSFPRFMRIIGWIWLLALTFFLFFTDRVTKIALIENKLLVIIGWLFTLILIGFDIYEVTKHLKKNIQQGSSMDSHVVDD